ncbi:unnamed protein product [Rotaria magnacalcarata]|uniref:S1 motif domain-containing protein n=1 Tax=Rotaria magnacalcarata TaxID=392030 RepID=A0A816Q9U4_9BILA|nr:unnamed protein product [Rotaria magnacalcarata]CAF1686207.1 unnamed protein product [Rotaria magnacalcarata]CAF2057497.1 unnamed protein product [Rotaria magnacalcarata]CAF2142675.1 unnamed protein product [Rotaria magnacalcarata]CAF2193378.1 unnamed protein product [Rotaria magnacalcarata]
MASSIIDPSIQKQLVVPGTILTNDTSNFMRGHGTYSDTTRNHLKASIAGVVNKVDRLLCVEPIENTRYLGEVGHVVIGRVLKVDQSRWVVDIQSRLDAYLPLASVNLPGGENRRRIEDDERNMRQYLKEGDLFSAEIQQIYQDGTLALQTRNLRYGKLGEGILVHVRSSLVKRTKNHFHSLPCGASVIRGCNGSIWICPPASTSSDTNSVDTGGYVKNIESVSIDVRKTIVRLSNCIRILNQLGLQIFDTSIMDIYELSSDYEIDDLIQPKIIQTISKHLQQQKGIINGGGEVSGGNGVDPYSHHMKEE